MNHIDKLESIYNLGADALEDQLNIERILREVPEQSGQKENSTALLTQRAFKNEDKTNPYLYAYLRSRLFALCGI